MRADGVFAESGGDDKSFRVVDYERCKRSAGAFDDGFFAFYEIQNVHGTCRAMRDARAKPVAAGFDELAVVKAGALFAPAAAFAQFAGND